MTGGTTVLSDSIKVRITAAAGSTFIDRMIALVEGAERQKTPNELALSILLSGLTLIFLIVCVTLWPLAGYSGTVLSVTVLIALLVCLIPTTIGGLLVGDRHRRHGPADPLQRHRHLRPRRRGGGRRRHAAARQDRHDHLRQPHGRRVHRGRGRRRNASWPRRCCWRASPTRRRRAARSSRSPRAATASRRRRICGQATIVPFTAQTRMSGVDLPGRVLRKGAVDAILAQAGLTRDKRAGRFQSGGRSHLALRRHAAGGLRQRPVARHRPPQGHRQARHPAALRRTARDGHQDGDGHRRQSAHRRRDRFGSRRRRFPRAGDAGGQARLHPAKSSRAAG